MMPQMQSAFLNWSETVQMKVITKEAVDFESVENVDAVVTFDAVLQALTPRQVNRKPEGERIWKYWTMYSTTRVEKDTVVQDPAGKQYRVTSTDDWSQAGFYKSELVQQPFGLGEVSSAY